MRININNPPEAYFKEDKGPRAKVNRELAMKYTQMVKEKCIMLQEVLQQASESQAKYFNEKRIDM